MAQVGFSVTHYSSFLFITHMELVVLLSIEGHSLNRTHVLNRNLIQFFYECAYEKVKKHPPKVFYEKGVFRNPAIFTREQFCLSLFLIKY